MIILSKGSYCHYNTDYGRTDQSGQVWKTRAINNKDVRDTLTVQLYTTYKEGMVLIQFPRNGTVVQENFLKNGEVVQVRSTFVGHVKNGPSNIMNGKKYVATKRTGNKQTYWIELPNSNRKLVDDRREDAMEKNCGYSASAAADERRAMSRQRRQSATGMSARRDAMTSPRKTG